MKVTTIKRRSKRAELIHRVEIRDTEAMHVANALQAQMMRAIELRNAAIDRDVRHAWNKQADTCAKLCADLYRACGYSCDSIADQILPEEFSFYAY